VTGAELISLNAPGGKIQFLKIVVILGGKQSMSGTRNAVTLVGVCLAFALASTVADAQSKRTRAAAARDVNQLIRMMDKDMNGVVSKQEFMDFMSQTFDRLDINRSGTLEPREVRPLTTPSWPGVGS
jgi:hypothetical protein